MTPGTAFRLLHVSLSKSDLFNSQIPLASSEISLKFIEVHHDCCKHVKLHNNKLWDSKRCTTKPVSLLFSLVKKYAEQLVLHPSSEAKALRWMMNWKNTSMIILLIPIRDGYRSEQRSLRISFVKIFDLWLCYSGSRGSPFFLFT